MAERAERRVFATTRFFFFVTVPKRVFFLNYFAPPSKQKQRRVLFDSRVEAFCSTFVIVHSSLLPSMKQAAPLKDRTLSFLPPFLPPPQCRSQSSQHSHHIGSRRRLLSTLKRRWRRGWCWCCPHTKWQDVTQFFTLFFLAERLEMELICYHLYIQSKKQNPQKIATAPRVKYKRKRDKSQHII